jgi:hypothetical protein
MSIVRGIVTLGLLGFVLWAAWFIAYYAGLQTSGATVPPPPGVHP